MLRYDSTTCQSSHISYRPHQWECVGDLSVRGQLGSKAVRREEFVAVVILDDLANSLQSHGVRVHLVRTHVVQGGGLGRVTWRRDAHTGQSELTSGGSEKKPAAASL